MTQGPICSQSVNSTISLQRDCEDWQEGGACGHSEAASGLKMGVDKPLSQADRFYAKSEIVADLGFGVKCKPEYQQALTAGVVIWGTQRPPWALGMVTPSSWPAPSL